MTKAMYDALYAHGDDGTDFGGWNDCDPLGAMGPAYYRIALYVPGSTCHQYQLLARKYSAKGAIRRADFLAMDYNFTHFAVRDPSGKTIFNGPRHNALGKPIKRKVGATQWG